MSAGWRASLDRRVKRNRRRANASDRNLWVRSGRLVSLSSGTIRFMRFTRFQLTRCIAGVIDTTRDAKPRCNFRCSFSSRLPFRRCFTRNFRNKTIHTHSMCDVCKPDTVLCIDKDLTSKRYDELRRTQESGVNLTPLYLQDRTLRRK